MYRGRFGPIKGKSNALACAKNSHARYAVTLFARMDATSWRKTPTKCAKTIWLCPSHRAVRGCSPSLLLNYDAIYIPYSQRIA